MKRTILSIFVICTALLFLTRTRRTVVFVSPDATRKVVVMGRPKLDLETWQLKIRLIDVASGKIIAKEKIDVLNVFLDRFIDGTYTEHYPVGAEWIENGSVNIVISDRASVIQLPSGKRFDIWSPEYLKEGQ